MTYTRKELAECAAREVEKRREVYGRMIAARKMRPLVAQHHIDLMNAIMRVLMKITDEDCEKAQQ